MLDHGRFDYSPIIRRPPLRWPNNARVALWVIPNIEHFLFEGHGTPISPRSVGFTPDVLNYAWRDYAPRVGIWRLMELLDRHGIRATVALNSAVCQYNPAIIEEGVKRNWEWMGHGITNSTPIPTLGSEDEEREVIQTVYTTIKQATGRAPEGWLGPGLSETVHTPDLLAEVGFTYLCDWCNDDQPYPMRTKRGRLISVPYSIEINDISSILTKAYTAAEFGQMIRDQFDVLYAEGARSGRVMAIALHPFIIGVPSRIKYLDQALTYILGHPDVWVTTGGEIAGWYRDHGLAPA
ncbi:MAG: polysaccharide deacetylase family protein [Deltaproteobacteria bacterium]|nr:polysaccharide deacetylase family protein [Deltaproteobacteria bacterium]